MRKAGSALGRRTTSSLFSSASGRDSRLFTRLCFVPALIVAFVGAPGLASTPSHGRKPLGSIAETARARLDGISASTGANLYPGDVVETDAAGVLRLRLGSGQLFLSAASSASLEQRGNFASVTLAKGAATFSLPDPLQFELKTPAGTLRGSGTHPTSGQVVIFTPQQIVVTASKGDLVLDHAGQFYTIREGRSYRIVIEDDPAMPHAAPSRSADRPNPAARHRKLLFFPVAKAGLVAATFPF